MSYKNELKRKEYNKRYYLDNKSDFIANQREYYYKNHEKILAQKRIYAIRHKEKARLYEQINKEQNLTWLLSYLGRGKMSCEKCGYSKCFAAIQGHHINPNEKEHHRDGFGRWLHLKGKSFQEKIIKNHIVFLCANCHAELHAQ